MYSKGGDYMTEYMSYKAAAEYLGLKTQNTLREYIAAGLPTIQVGRSKRISKTAIDKFMAEHQSQVKGGK